MPETARILKSDIICPHTISTEETNKFAAAENGGEISPLDIRTILSYYYTR